MKNSTSTSPFRMSCSFGQGRDSGSRPSHRPIHRGEAAPASLTVTLGSVSRSKKIPVADRIARCHSLTESGIAPRCQVSSLALGVREPRDLQPFLDREDEASGCRAVRVDDVDPVIRNQFLQESESVIVAGAAQLGQVFGPGGPGRWTRIPLDENHTRINQRRHPGVALRRLRIAEEDLVIVR